MQYPSVLPVASTSAQVYSQQVFGQQGPSDAYGAGRYGAVQTSAISGLQATVPTSLIFPYALPSAAGPIHGLADGIRTYALPLHGAEQLVYEKDAASALAERLAEGLHLGPKDYLQPAATSLAQYYARVGAPQALPLYYQAAAPAPVAASRQQQPTAIRYGQAQTAGRGGRGVFGNAPNLPMGRAVQQKKRRSQKGMEDNIRRTVYISYLDQTVTEEQLASFFAECGKVVDCRVCGDPNSAMRFAFIEFTEEEAARKALDKTGIVLGSSPLRVLPSKTAIMPVNRELMPRSHDDVERCSRTVYVANIDKKVDRNDVRSFFEQLCGKVAKIRLLGDYAHTTRIAFLEFEDASAAQAALNCSGALLGSLPLRVSPSKTPVRDEPKEPPPGPSSTASSAVAAAPSGVNEVSASQS